MDQFIAEIRKIPPVTRFICGSSLGVTGSVLLGAVAPYTVLFVKDFVFKKLQVYLFLILAFIWANIISAMEALYGLLFWRWTLLSASLSLKLRLGYCDLRWRDSIYLWICYAIVCTAMCQFLFPTSLLISNRSRTVNDLETKSYSNRSADFAWQLFWACGGILVCSHLKVLNDCLPGFRLLPCPCEPTCSHDPYSSASYISIPHSLLQDPWRL